ncbi:unnamed protein product [Adineta ricciae]|nr:unnamed protein product [Adineta ricciae]
MNFDELSHIKYIKVHPLKGDTPIRGNSFVELLRYITSSPNLPDYLYLNRGYRRIELINTSSWKIKRGWSKQDLNYDDQHELKLITLSFDGNCLVMNVKWNDCERFIDLRKHDGQLILIKRIRMENESSALLHRIQIPFEQDFWLIIDDNRNQLYKVSIDPNDERIVPIKTNQIKAIQNVPSHFRFIPNQKYLLVGAVIGNSTQKQGVFKFFRLPHSSSTQNQKSN